MLTTRMLELDKDLLAGLEAAGFRTDAGHDGTGYYMKYLRSGGGYYLNVGCSELIVSGEIRVVQNAAIRNYRADGIELTDGSASRPTLWSLPRVRKYAGDCGPHDGRRNSLEGRSRMGVRRARGHAQRVAADGARKSLVYGSGALLSAAHIHVGVALQIKAIRDGLVTHRASAPVRMSTDPRGLPSPRGDRDWTRRGIVPAGPPPILVAAALTGVGIGTPGRPVQYSTPVFWRIALRGDGAAAGAAAAAAGGALWRGDSIVTWRRSTPTGAGGLDDLRNGGARCTNRLRDAHHGAGSGRRRGGAARAATVRLLDLRNLVHAPGVRRRGAGGASSRRRRALLRSTGIFGVEGGAFTTSRTLARSSGDLTRHGHVAHSRARERSVQ